VQSLPPLEIVLASIRARAGIELTQDQFDDDLVGLGVDSLAAIDVANDMEEALGIVIDDREIVRFRTVNMIARYFETLRPNHD
jgi:acyl carrier protein